jgi:putative inorganic carbon (HCO3(-)) transporter
MLRTLLVLSILIPGIVMAVQNRFIALLMYLWFAFFRPQDWMWIDVSSLRLSLILGLILLVPAPFAGIWPNLTHVMSWGTIGFLVSALLAQMNAANQAIGWAWIDFLVRLTLVCLLTVTLVNTPQRLMQVIAVVGGSLGFHAARAGLHSVLGGGLQFADGLSGAFIDNNGYALATVMIMPLLLVVAQNASLLFDPGVSWSWLTPWFRRAFLVAIPFCAFTVVSTFSRAGFLALAAAVMMYVALHRRRVSMSVGIATAVVLILAFAPIPAGYFDRIETITTYEEVGDESAISRLHFWRVAVEMARAEPLGIGLRNFEVVYPYYDWTEGKYGLNRSVHSSHFQVLAELGVLGTLAWVGLFVIAIAMLVRVRFRSRAPNLTPEQATFLMTTSVALLVSMVGFLVGGSFIALALNDITWLTFALVAALDRISAAMIEEPSATPALAPLQVQVPPSKHKTLAPVVSTWRPRTPSPR